MSRIIKKLSNLFAVRLLGHKHDVVCYAGNYGSWHDAMQDSDGYDTDLILHKVRDSLLKVKQGDAVYERDSVIFDEIRYSWPLLAGLLWISSCNSNRLHVLDFGGSLGSSYFQNRHFLSHLAEISWNIVEQPKFVECGKQHFEDNILRFYNSMEECLTYCPCDTILLSGVLPYIEKPHDLLERIIDLGFKYIIIDRIPLFMGNMPDRLTVQNVPMHIYKARYPAWFLNRDGFLSHFKDCYETVATFDALAGAIFIGGEVAQDKGFLFKRLDSRV